MYDGGGAAYRMSVKIQYRVIDFTKRVVWCGTWRAAEGVSDGVDPWKKNKPCRIREISFF